MKNYIIPLLLVAIVVIAGGFIILNQKSGQNITTGNAVTQSSSENSGDSNVQRIALSIKDYNYYPNTIKVKAGIPVSISLDSTVSGCYRSFTIRELGIAKTLRTPQDQLVFTPKTPGTYRFACSMGMGTGTLIVE